MGNKDDAVKFKTDSLLVGRTDTEIIHTDRNQVFSVIGGKFVATNPDTDQVSIDSGDGSIKAEADAITLICPVTLPQNATLREVTVYGNAAATAETFDLLRVSVNGTSAESVLSAATAIGTTATTFDFQKADPLTHHYYLVTSSIDTNDRIYGALIKYGY